MNRTDIAGKAPIASLSGSGFPCRSQGCHTAFHVYDGGSMDDLARASKTRTEHEATVHSLVVPAPPPPSQVARGWTPQMRALSSFKRRHE